MSQSKHSDTVELVLCIFLGYLGVHRFYTKKYGTAVIYLLTGGLCGIGWIVDIVTIILRMCKAKPAAAAASPAPEGKTYRVAGVDHYLDNLLQLATENSDYALTKKEIISRKLVDKTIWKYQFRYHGAELVPEPENPHDPNAIKVLVDGLHVGYIKAGSCAHLLKMMKDHDVRISSCRIGGGPSKMVTDNGDGEYELEKDDGYYSVTLSIIEG